MNAETSDRANLRLSHFPLSFVATLYSRLLLDTLSKKNIFSISQTMNIFFFFLVPFHFPYLLSSIAKFLFSLFQIVSIDHLVILFSVLLMAYLINFPRDFVLFTFSRKFAGCGILWIVAKNNEKHCVLFLQTIYWKFLNYYCKALWTTAKIVIVKSFLVSSIDASFPPF